MTKYGPVKTDFMLFIAAGAFHVAKISDLIPELQGRFPIKVELKPLKAAEFKSILTQPENAIIKQYHALLATEGVNLVFKDDAIDAIAKYAEIVNDTTENIGARRLHTIMENMLDDISFNARRCGHRCRCGDRCRLRQQSLKQQYERHRFTSIYTVIKRL